MTAIIAHGGIEGLRLTEEYRSSLSLVILDIMMPDLDGFQVLQKIREVSNVPVLMLTAKSDEEDKVSGLRLGADDYLTKPFSINKAGLFHLLYENMKKARLRQGFGKVSAL